MAGSVAACPYTFIGSFDMLALQDILFSQGFGTRRVCTGLVQQGWVQIGEERDACDDPLAGLTEVAILSTGCKVSGGLTIRWPTCS